MALTSTLHRGTRALLETLKNVTTGTTTTTTTPTLPPPPSSSSSTPPIKAKDDGVIAPNAAAGGFGDLSSYRHYLDQILPSDNHNNHHNDSMSAFNGTRYVNGTTAIMPSLGEEENTTGFSTSWLSIRLVLIVSVLVCIGLLAFGSYKLHSRCAARRKSRPYKSTLLLYGGEVTVRSNNL